MTKAKSILALMGAITLGSAAYLLGFRRPSVPDYAGQPVSAWFEGLCSGVYGGSPKANRFSDSYAAFAEMEADAVPYLTQQLRYDKSGIRQKLIGHLRQYAVSRRFATNLIWPTERRNYATVALRRMGPKAEAAIPALLEAWATDAPEVKVNAVSALESILRGQYTDVASPAEWKRMESDVVTETARRYPSVAAGLGIGCDRVQ
jgi:hypothetical protein